MKNNDVNNDVWTKWDTVTLIVDILICIVNPIIMVYLMYTYNDMGIFLMIVAWFVIIFSLMILGFIFGAFYMAWICYKNINE